MAERNIIQVTPFMLVPEIEPALAFMTDILGFQIDYRAGDYAYVSRDGAGLRMMAAGPGNPFVPGTRRFAHYFDCRDVDALYAELKPRLDGCRRATCTDGGQALGPAGAAGARAGRKPDRIRADNLVKRDSHSHRPASAIIYIM